MSDASCWNKMTDIEEIAWLWNETNQHIENFLATLDSPEIYMQVKAKEMFNDVDICGRLCKFTSAKISRQAIVSMLGRKVNKQLTGSMPLYKQWTVEKKDQLRRYATLAEHYGYKL